jgi:hypothetical protein
MRNFNKTYSTLKLFRGERKNQELIKLSEEEMDFEYRRLLIEEREKDLHVAFSRCFISKNLSYILLGISLITVAITPISKIFLILSFFMFGLMLFYKRKFNKILINFNFALILVDHVIKETHGISLPKYL